MKEYDKLIFEISRPGRKGYELPADRYATDGLGAIPASLRRDEPLDLPEVSELDVVRHYTNLSNKNFGVDTGFYPLGSCTMKYNPKINEELASMREFSGLHPLQPAETAQGALELYWNLQRLVVAGRSGGIYAQSLRRRPRRADGSDGDAPLPRAARRRQAHQGDCA